MSKRGRDILGPPAGHPDARKTRKQSHLGDALRASGAALRIGSDAMALVFQFLRRKDALMTIRVCRTWYAVLANHNTLRCNWKTHVCATTWHTIPPHFRRHIGSIELFTCKWECKHKKCLSALGSRALQTLGTLSHLRYLDIRVPSAPIGPTHAVAKAAIADVCAPPPQLDTLGLAIGGVDRRETPDWYITYLLKRLAPPMNLRRLTIASAGFQKPQGGFFGLQAYPGLTFLDLSDCRVLLVGFTTIKTCLPNLVELRLESNVGIDKLAELCSAPHVLTQLTTLVIPYVEVNAETVRHLGHLPQLAHVDTDGDEWNLDTLAVCHLLPRIVSLDVENWNDTVFDLRAFKTYDMRHVESLTLHDVMCYDAGAFVAGGADRDPSADFFAALAGMPRLHTLILRECHIPDLAWLVHPALKKVSTFSAQGRFRYSVWPGERAAHEKAAALSDSPA